MICFFSWPNRKWIAKSIGYKIKPIKTMAVLLLLLLLVIIIPYIMLYRFLIFSHSSMVRAALVESVYVSGRLGLSVLSPHSLTPLEVTLEAQWDTEFEKDINCLILSLILLSWILWSPPQSPFPLLLVTDKTSILESAPYPLKPTSFGKRPYTPGSRCGVCRKRSVIPTPGLGYWFKGRNMPQFGPMRLTVHWSFLGVCKKEASSLF